MSIQPDLKPVMTIDYVAALLQVEPETVKDYVRSHKLRAARLGSVWMFTETQFVQDIQRLADASDTPSPKAIQVAVPKRKGPPDLTLLGA